jgi:hypothetical protein
MSARSLFPVALLLVACGADDDTLEVGPVVEVYGEMARVDARPDAPWVGTETVRVVDADGALVCQGDVDLDAVGAAEPPCPRCELTLDVLRSTLRDLAQDCDLISEAPPLGLSERFLAFTPTSAKTPSLGRVAQAPRPDGPWTDFASGVLSDGRLFYQRTESLPEVP